MADRATLALAGCHDGRRGRHRQLADRGHTTPTYEAQTRLIVGPTLDSPSATFDTLRSASQLVVTYRELVKTGTPLDNTIADLSLPYTRAELGSHITVISSDVTRLLTIRVKDSNPERAAAIANTLANRLVERSGQSNTPESQLTVVETAEPNFSPTSPNKPMILVFGTTAAVLLLGGFILLIELMQNHVKTEDDLRELTHAQVLGGFMLGRRRNQTDPFLAGDGRSHPAPEAYQIASLKLLATARDAAAGRDHPGLRADLHRRDSRSDCLPGRGLRSGGPRHAAGRRRPRPVVTCRASSAVSANRASSIS